MIKLKNITKNYDGLQVFDKFNLTIQEKEIVCLLGPSGCGKTTLLNMISGLVQLNDGGIEGVEDKKFSYIFQENRLIPWITIGENISFVLEGKYEKVKAQAIAKNYLDFVNLQEYKDYFPNKLSGGMKQRVSIARAFAYDSDILLMDEPFKGLDFELKQSLILAFTALWQKDKRTVIFVTHDLDEALILADVLYVLHGKPALIKNRIRIPHIQNLRNINSKEFKWYKNILKTEIQR